MSCAPSMSWGIAESPPVESAVERRELEALAEMVADAPWGLGRLTREEVETLAGLELAVFVPVPERGLAFLHWIDLLYVLKRWRRHHGEGEEALYREAVRQAFVEKERAWSERVAAGTAEALAERLRARSAEFRALNPKLTEPCYWLAPEALVGWVEGRLVWTEAG